MSEIYLKGTGMRALSYFKLLKIVVCNQRQ
jgi:hypothetical protein